MNSNYMQIPRIKAILKGLIFPMRCSFMGDVDKGGLNRESVLRCSRKSINILWDHICE